MAATHLELACATVALALLVALLGQPAAPVPVAAQTLAAPTASSNRFFEDPLAPPRMLPQACIKRVLALSRKQRHFDLVGVMERECFGAVAVATTKPVADVPTCLTPAGWHAAYARRVATGCLLD